MAKNDNLTDFLTDVADAIRYKKSATEKINPQDFAAQIMSIGNEGGSGSGPLPTPDAVRFLDCYGTLLHSYSTEDFLALTELPEPPIKEGLISQGWNWDIETAQSYVAQYRNLDIGASYITHNGKTRLYIKIAAEGRMTVPIYFSQTIANGVTIDWGDGSASETVSGTGNVNTSHTYAEIGEYIIVLNPSDACTISLGREQSYNSVLGSRAVYRNMLQAVEIGQGVTSIGAYAFSYCYSLASVVIPNGMTSIGTYAFRNCYSLASVVIPQGVTSIGAYAFQTCYSLASVVIPDSVTSIGTYAFRNCYSLASIVIPQGVTSIVSNAFYECHSLASIVIPNSVTSIGTFAFYKCNSLASIVIPQGVTSIDSNTFFGCSSLASIVIPQSVTSIGEDAFHNCYSLASIVIPQGVTSIGASAFHYCYSLASIVIPNSVTSIGAYAFYECNSLASIVIPQGVTSISSYTFYYCIGMAFYGFSTHTSVPALLATNAFHTIPSDCKIIVPDALYDDWIAAENWSTYASYIIKKSEWDAQ